MLEHMVYMSTPSTASREEVEKTVADYIDKIVIMLKSDFGFQGTGAHIINYIKNQKVYVGYSLVFTRYKEVALVMMGKNPDGTERIIFEPNEDLGGIPKWDDEDSTTHQFEDELNDWGDEESGTYQTLPPLVESPSEYAFSVFKVSDRYLNDDLSTNCLVMTTPKYYQGTNRSISGDISPEDIRNKFLIFSSDPKYPKVTINRTKNNGHVAHINFKPSTYDAIVAFMMIRYPEFKVKDTTHTYEVSQLNLSRQRR